MKKFCSLAWVALILALPSWGLVGLHAAENEQAQFKRAQELEAQKKYVEAETLYAKLIEANQTEPTLYTMRGWVRHLQKNEKDALVDLDLADMLKGKDPAILYRRGMVHKALDDSRKAALDFAVVAAADPKNSRARYELAYSLSRTGRHREALTAISEAIALEPKRAEYVMLRSVILEKLGEETQARADADLARSLTGDRKQQEATDQRRPQPAVAAAGETKGAQPGVQLPQTRPAPAQERLAVNGATSATAAQATTLPTTTPPPSALNPKSMATLAAGATRASVLNVAAGSAESATSLIELDINALSAGQYNGAVSVAMEGLRLVQAPMSDEATAKFEQKWTPMFSHPLPGNIAYLNKLNPLVQEWLALRGQLAEAAAAYDKSVEEARFAAGYESEAGVRTAMSDAGRNLELLQAGKVRLAELAAQIAQLGDPPDAVLAHRKRKNEHIDALKTARRIAGIPEEAVYLKVDFTRQPEGWAHQFMWTDSVTTVLPPEERILYIPANDSAVAARLQKDPTADPRTLWYSRSAARLITFHYLGADLADVATIDLTVNLAHAPVDRAEDLGVGIAQDDGKFDYGTVTIAGDFGKVATNESSSDHRLTSHISRLQQIALDVGRGHENYWAIVHVDAQIGSRVGEVYPTSDNEKAEKALWQERLAILRQRVASRINSLLNSLRMEMSLEKPAQDPDARYAALYAFAKANPIRPESAGDYARRDWRNGHWALRPGADPVPSLSQAIQAGNAGYSIFDEGKTVFRTSWTRPPIQLKPGTAFDFEITTENTKQDITIRSDGSQSIVDLTAYGQARWSNLAGREVVCENGFAHADAAKGERRTHARLSIPIAEPSGSYTREVRIGFSEGYDRRQYDPNRSAYSKHEVTYLYDWTWELGGDNPAIPQSVLPANMSAEPRLPPLTPAEIAKIEAEKKWKKERIAEIRQNIAFLSQCLSREQEERGRERDTTRVGSYDFRIIGLQSDIQHEEDMIKSLETGLDVHTRSPFDNYAGAVFQQQCQTEAREASQMVRAVGAANRLAAMLPADEAEKMRDFIGRQLTPKVVGTHDVKTARAVLTAVNSTVRGHLEGVAAKADMDAASAQLGMEAAENIKYAADQGMATCSLFGGQSINLLYQAGTGYVEGGPLQALKSAATTWSDTIDYAVTAYDAYKEGGAAGAAKAAGLKYAQSKAMSYIAGRFMGDPGRGTSEAGHLRKPTLQEQFDAAKFQQERGWGEALVKDFERAHLELKKAGGAGAAPEVIKQLQLAATDKAGAIASSLHAKNYLKYKADAGLGQAYDAHMRSIHAETDAGLKTQMKQAGWNADEWDLTEFRNSASFGKPNMDRDVGLRERPLWQVDEKGVQITGADGRPIPNPAAWTTGATGAPVPKPQLTKNGKPMTLDAWRDEAQQLYNKAYRKASGGRSAEIAMEGVTTSTHPEAYKDLQWLGQDKGLINQAWAGQAADVTRYKAQHILNKGDPSAAYFTKLQEVSRGTAKDMASKLMPLLKSAKPISGGGLITQSSLTTAAIGRAQSHWSEVQSVLQSFGRNDTDPITATRRIRELTGGKSIPEVVDEMATLLESLAKGVRRR